MRPIKEIIVHCSATRPEWMADKTILQKRHEIRRWHVEGNKWKDIGYHYLVDRNGETVEARPLDQVGAHVKGRNTGTIGICLIGGHGGSEGDSFLDHFTPEQDAALRGLINTLRARFGDVPVTGHNQYAAKACPCFYAPAWWAGGAARKVTPQLQEVVAVIEDADKDMWSSSTIIAQIKQLVGAFGATGGTALAFFSQQSEGTQIALIVAALVALGGMYWIVKGSAHTIRERRRKTQDAQRAKKAMGL